MILLDASDLGASRPGRQLFEHISLTLSTGQFSGALMQSVSQPNSIQQSLRASSNVGFGIETGQCWQQHIFQYAALRQQLVILKNEPDMLIAK